MSSRYLMVLAMDPKILKTLNTIILMENNDNIKKKKK